MNSGLIPDKYSSEFGIRNVPNMLDYDSPSVNYYDVGDIDDKDYGEDIPVSGVPSLKKTIPSIQIKPSLHTFDDVQTQNKMRNVVKEAPDLWLNGSSRLIASVIESENHYLDYGNKKRMRNDDDPTRPTRNPHRVEYPWTTENRQKVVNRDNQDNIYSDPKDEDSNQVSQDSLNYKNLTDPKKDYTQRYFNYFKDKNNFDLHF